MEALECTQALEFESFNDQFRAIQKPTVQKSKVAYLVPNVKDNKSHPLFEGENVIGRSLSCGVRIDNKVLSKKHAILEIERNSFFLQDQNSMNGTFKGKIRLKPMVMYHVEIGEALMFGNIGFKLMLQDQESASENSPPISPTQACSDPTFTFNENDNNAGTEETNPAVSALSENNAKQNAQIETSETDIKSDNETDSELEGVEKNLEFRKNAKRKDDLSDDDDTVSEGEFQAQKVSMPVQEEPKVENMSLLEGRKSNLQAETQDILEDDLEGLASDEESLLVHAEHSPKKGKCMKCNGDNTDDHMCLEADSSGADSDANSEEDDSLLLQPTQPYHSIATVSKLKKIQAFKPKSNKSAKLNEDSSDDNDFMLAQTQPFLKSKEKFGNENVKSTKVDTDVAGPSHSLKGLEENADDPMLFAQTQPFKDSDFVKPLSLTPRRMKNLLPNNTESVDPNAFTQPCLSLDDFEEVEDFDCDSTLDKGKDKDSLLYAETQPMDVRSRSSKKDLDESKPSSLMVETQPFLDKSKVNLYAETQLLVPNKLSNKSKGNKRAVDILMADTQPSCSSKITKEKDKGDKNWMDLETQVTGGESEDWMNAETQETCGENDDWENTQTQKSEADEKWINAETQPTEIKSDFPKSRRRLYEHTKSPNESTPKSFTLQFEDSFVGNNSRVSDILCMDSQPNSREESTPVSSRQRKSFNETTVAETPSDISASTDKRNNQTVDSFNDSLLNAKGSTSTPVGTQSTLSNSETVSTLKNTDCSSMETVVNCHVAENELGINEDQVSCSPTLKNSESLSFPKSDLNSEEAGTKSSEAADTESSETNTEDNKLPGKSNKSSRLGKKSAKTMRKFVLIEESRTSENFSSVAEFESNSNTDAENKKNNDATDSSVKVTTGRKGRNNSKLQANKEKTSDKVDKKQVNPKPKRAQANKGNSNSPKDNIFDESIETKSRFSSRVRRLPAKLRSDFEVDEQSDSNNVLSNNTDIDESLPDDNKISMNKKRKNGNRTEKMTPRNLGDREDKAGSSGLGANDVDPSHVNIVNIENSGIKTKPSTKKQTSVVNVSDTNGCENALAITSSKNGNNPNGNELLNTVSVSEEVNVTNEKRGRMKRKGFNKKDVNTEGRPSKLPNEVESAEVSPRDSTVESVTEKTEKPTEHKRRKAVFPLSPENLDLAATEVEPPKTSTTLSSEQAEDQEKTVEDSNICSEREISDKNKAVEQNDDEKLTSVLPKRRGRQPKKTGRSDDMNPSELPTLVQEDDNIGSLTTAEESSTEPSSQSSKRRGRKTKEVVTDASSTEADLGSSANDTKAELEAGKVAKSSNKGSSRKLKPANKQKLDIDIETVDSSSTAGDSGRRGRAQKTSKVLEQKASSTENVHHTRASSSDGTKAEDNDKAEAEKSSDIIRTPKKAASRKSGSANKQKSEVDNETAGSSSRRGRTQKKSKVSEQKDSSLEASSTGHVKESSAGKTRPDGNNKDDSEKAVKKAGARKSTTATKTKSGLDNETDESSSTAESSGRKGRTQKKIKLSEEEASEDTFAVPSSSGRKRHSSTDNSNTPVKKRSQQSESDSSRERQAKNVPESSPRSTGRTSAVPKKVSVLFTGISDEEAEEAISNLGGSVVSEVNHCTHLCTDKFRRTVKFLCCVGKGIPIVGMEWIAACKSEKRFVDPQGYILHDKVAERTYSFQLSRTLQDALKSPLLENWSVYVTPAVVPKPDQMKEIIESAGGKFMSKSPNRFMDQILVISCDADKKVASRFVKMGFPVVSNEFLLTGLVRHKICFKEFSLSF